VGGPDSGPGCNGQVTIDVDEEGRRFFAKLSFVVLVETLWVYLTHISVRSHNLVASTSSSGTAMTQSEMSHPHLAPPQRTRLEDTLTNERIRKYKMRALTSKSSALAQPSSPTALNSLSGNTKNSGTPIARAANDHNRSHSVTKGQSAT
jgi:hypothetical protein